MNENLRTWRALARPPQHALKTIRGGRLQGMTDVNPQWRYEAMAEHFGPCGVGWCWSITRTWTETGTDGQVVAWAEVAVKTRTQPVTWTDVHTRASGVLSVPAWSEPIPGIGGSLMVAKEKDGLRTNDEAFKMAVTDALSVALKFIGVAADIYAGRWDGSKWSEVVDETSLEHYHEWLDDMAAAADEGYDKLIAAVKASKEEFQSALRGDKQAWSALKAKAEKR